MKQTLEGKKELKDFLHLYLGCDCMTPDGVLVLNGLNINDSRNQVWFYCRWSDSKNCYLPKRNAKILGKQSLVGKAFKYSEINPILRPLSDMTDKEKMDLRAHFLEMDNPYNTGHTPWHFEQTRYLLSNHFDLFGLIESGLAIDKTTLK